MCKYSSQPTLFQIPNPSYKFCDKFAEVQNYYGEMCVLHVLRPTLVKTPYLWHKLCVKFAKCQNDEIYHTLRTSHFRAGMLVWWNNDTAGTLQCSPRYLKLPTSHTIFVIILLNFKTTRYTTAYELRISVQECWFGEICERTVAYVVLQSPTHRIHLC